MLSRVTSPKGLQQCNQVNFDGSPLTAKETLIRVVEKKMLEIKVACLSSPLTMSYEPTYTRGGKTWPVVATAANANLRSLLLSEEHSIAEATVKLQLRTWEKAAALAQVKDQGFGQLLGIDFDSIPFKGQFGEHAESDVDAIVEEIRRAAPDKTSLKDICTWERVPYVLRCVGLARGSTEGEHPNTSERPAKKSRVQGRDELVPDLDEWYASCPDSARR